MFRDPVEAFLFVIQELHVVFARIAFPRNMPVRSDFVQSLHGSPWLDDLILKKRIQEADDAVAGREDVESGFDLRLAGNGAAESFQRQRMVIHFVQGLELIPGDAVKIECL